MSKLLWTLALLSPLLPAQAWGQSLGEPVGTFPDWTERAVQVFTNRARCDPQADLAACAQSGACAEHACYSPQAPLAWDLALNQAARFHSANLQASGSRLQHDSPCTLRADIAQRYNSGACDGEPACACEGGQVGCGPQGCTSFSQRLSLFGVRAGGAENAAPNGDPERIFYLWLHERDTSDACGWRISNGHRANLLGAGLTTLGVGASGNFMTQDFGRAGAIPVVPSGIHFPQQVGAGQPITWRANYYLAGGQGPSRAAVVVQGQCHDMSLERGSLDNGTWAFEGTAQGCADYYFLFEDAQGAHRYPAEGSLLVSAGAACPQLYQRGQAPASCLGEAPQPDMGAPDLADLSSPDLGEPDFGEPDLPQAGPDGAEPDVPQGPDGFVGDRGPDGFVDDLGGQGGEGGCAAAPRAGALGRWLGWWWRR